MEYLVLKFRKLLAFNQGGELPDPVILKFRNSKSFNQGGGMYAVKKVELQRLVVLAKSPVNSPGKVFTTADGENNRNNTNTNTGKDTSLNHKSQSKHENLSPVTWPGKVFTTVYCWW